MYRFILLFIAFGLLWNTQVSIIKALDSQSKKSLTFNIFEEEIPSSRVDSSEDDKQNELERFDLLASHTVEKKLPKYNSYKTNCCSPTLLSYISPVFTPPPDLS